MAEKCAFPGCERYAILGKFCIGHSKHFREIPAEKPAPKPIKKVSDKERKIKRELGLAYAIFLAKPKNHRCAIKSPECTGKATTVNHTNGRGANVKNEKDWEPSCWACNGYIERHHQWATERGHKKMRHSKSLSK